LIKVKTIGTAFAARMRRFREAPTRAGSPDEAD